MMKKIIYGIILAGLLLLMGCHTKTKDIKTSASVQIQGVSEVVLYEDLGFSLKLKAVESVEGNRKIYAVQMENTTEKSGTAYIREVVVNGHYAIGEDEMFFLNPFEVSQNLLEELAEVSYTENLQSLESIQCHLIINDENYNVIEDQIIDMTFDKPLVHAVEYDQIRDAKADTQVLLENEAVKLTLIEWGKNPDNRSVSTIVCVENHSDMTIPAMISGLRINGIYFQSSELVNHLGPGQKCYAQTSILESEIESAGIMSIQEVEVMILTDESQNTGSVSYAGGEWYPIVLSEKGESDEIRVAGELLDTVEGVEISYLEADETEWSDGGYYEWKLSVVNGTDEHIRVGLTDVLVDGIPEEQWMENYPDCAVYVADGEVGANASRYMHIRLSYETYIQRPELSFKFYIRSMAGSSVIGTGINQITLLPEQ